MRMYMRTHSVCNASKRKRKGKVKTYYTISEKEINTSVFKKKES